MKPKRLLILGSGFGAVYTYRALHRALHPMKNKLSVTLVSKHNYFLFSPMLHEVATGGLQLTNIVQPVRHIMSCCVERFYEDEVTDIDLAARQVSSKKRLYNYDYALLSMGAKTNFFDTKGAAEHSLTLKSIQDAKKIRNHALHLLETATHEENSEKKKALLRWIIVGGGPTGVELAAELAELAEAHAVVAPQFNSNELSIEIHQSAQALLPQFDARMQDGAKRIILKKNIKLHLQSRVQSVGKATVMTSTKGEQEVGMVVWTAGIAPASITVKPEIRDSRNRFPVNQSLNLEKYPEVFVVGDIAAIDKVPQTAQAAVAAGTVAGKNIARALTGQKLLSFSFHSKGELVSLGQWQAVGKLHRVYVEGWFAWWLWRTIYLFKLVGIPNRIRVAFDWTLNIFFNRDISEV